MKIPNSNRFGHSHKRASSAPAQGAQGKENLPPKSANIPPPSSAKKSTPAQSQALRPTNILDRTVTVGDKPPVSIREALEHSDSAYSILPSYIKELVHRSLEQRYAKESDPISYKNSAEFDKLVADYVDYHLQETTFTESQKAVIRAIPSVLGYELRPYFIIESIRAGILSPGACDRLMQEIKEAAPDADLQKSILASFVGQFKEQFSQYHHASLLHQLKSDGFRIEKAADNGNCFYLAVLNSASAAGMEPLSARPDRGEKPDPVENSKISKKKLQQQQQMRLRWLVHDFAKALLPHFYTTDVEGKVIPTKAFKTVINTFSPNDPRRSLYELTLSYENLLRLAHSDAITKDKEWANFDYAILVSIASVHPVHVYGTEFTDASGKFVPMVFDTGGNGELIKAEPLRIVFNGANHFDSVLPPK